MQLWTFGIASVALGVASIACSSASPPVKEPAQAPEPSAPEPVIDFEVGAYANVYRGDEGLRITVVPLVGEEPEQALIEVSGAPMTSIDGLVLRYEKQPAGRARWSYVTTIDGGDFHLFWHTTRRDSTQVDIYLPGAPTQGRQVVYDDAAGDAIDVDELARRHAELVADKTIAELAKLDREGREARAETEFAERMGRSFEACGVEATTSIDWTTVTDEQIRRYAVGGWGYCGAIGRGLSNACRFSVGRALVRARIDAVHCEIGDDDMAVSLTTDGTLRWTADFDATNLADHAFDLLRAHLGLDRFVLRSEGGLWIALDPGDPNEPVHVSQDGETFFEHRDTLSSSGWRRELFGAGIRSTLSHEDDGWRVSCGDEVHALSELPIEKARQLWADATVEGTQWRREPYALARDDRGRYFYVDRFAEEFGGTGFRVFSGMRGNARLTRLVDVVDDSAGTVFSTENGDLRLIISRDVIGEDFWVERNRRIPLTVLPVRENLALIYRGLGAYAGEPLGTICEMI